MAAKMQRQDGSTAPELNALGGVGSSDREGQTASTRTKGAVAGTTLLKNHTRQFSEEEIGIKFK